MQKQHTPAEYDTRILDCTTPDSESARAAIDNAAALLRNSELVAFPTETVYGLGACIFNPEQVQRIFAVKQRPQDNPLIAHIADKEQIELIARDIPDSVVALTDSFFPGALTLVLKKHPGVPSVVSAGLDSIALRMPDHPVARALIRASGEPLVAPSANTSGRPSPTSASAVYDDLHGKIPLILDGGNCRIGLESTVLSMLEKPPRILRYGSITKEQIEDVLRSTVLLPNGNDAHHSPGTRHKHYSPNAAVILVESDADVDEYIKQHGNHSIRVFRYNTAPPDTLSVSFSASTYYAMLRQADSDGMTLIILCVSDALRANVALYDRVLRTAGKTG
ncbi:MAG: threonylcarbamoyl-AMP synthase [Candidatus Kapabacteria bacterium]|nr:threonylcarbamoyl-AMP synthase [Candidatus Kapabacteria bacterium]